MQARRNAASGEQVDVSNTAGQKYDSPEAALIANPTAENITEYNKRFNKGQSGAAEKILGKK